MICLNRKILIQEGRQLNSNEFLIHLSQIPLNFPEGVFLYHPNKS